MPKIKANGVELFYEESGAGEPLVLVHGSWIDHTTWGRVVPLLAPSFRVIAYDRRGHSQSERPPGAGNIQQDAGDLAALIEAMGIAPAHIVGHSFGGCIVMRLAGQRPELFRSMVVHEPPLIPLLAGDPQGQVLLKELQPRVDAVIERLEAGDYHEGVRLFVETIAFGPGEWGPVPQEFKNMVINNAPTFLDEMHDPTALYIDIELLNHFPHPMLLTRGENSPAFMRRVVELLWERIPLTRKVEYAGAGHEPEDGHPELLARTLSEFIRQAEKEQRPA